MQPSTSGRYLQQDQLCGSRSRPGSSALNYTPFSTSVRRYSSRKSSRMARFRSIPLAPTEAFTTIVADVATTLAPANTFDPVFNPAIGVAAAVAAVPPIIFWVRVVLAEQRRKKEIEDKEKARLVSVVIAVTSCRTKKRNKTRNKTYLYESYAGAET